MERTEARYAAHLRIDDSLDQRRRDRGIHGVAAGAQAIQSRFDRLGLRRRYHSLRHDGSPAAAG